MVAASISVASRIEVATSALHSKQYFSFFPGSSNTSVRRPQTLHGKTDGSSLPFGPHNIDVPPHRPLRGLPPSTKPFPNVPSRVSYPRHARRGSTGIDVEIIRSGPVGRNRVAGRIRVAFARRRPIERGCLLFFAIVLAGQSARPSSMPFVVQEFEEEINHEIRAENTQREEYGK